MLSSWRARTFGFYVLAGYARDDSIESPAWSTPDSGIDVRGSSPLIQLEKKDIRLMRYCFSGAIPTLHTSVSLQSMKKWGFYGLGYPTPRGTLSLRPINYLYLEGNVKALPQNEGIRGINSEGSSLKQNGTDTITENRTTTQSRSDTRNCSPGTAF